jgi:hypothetical protein
MTEGTKPNHIGTHTPHSTLPPSALHSQYAYCSNRGEECRLRSEDRSGGCERHGRFTAGTPLRGAHGPFERQRRRAPHPPPDPRPPNSTSILNLLAAPP